MASYRVFVAARVERVRETLAEMLRCDPAPYDVLARGEAPASFAELGTFRPHVVVLAVPVDGAAAWREAVERLRGDEDGRDAALIAVLLRRHAETLEALLEHGAQGVALWDELTSEQLGTRVRFALDRLKPRHPYLKVGGIELSISEHRVTIGSRTARLSGTDFDVLHRLMTARGAAVAFHDIAGGGGSASRSRGKSRIRRLRRRLGPSGDRIESVPGVGYRLRVDQEAG